MGDCTYVFEYRDPRNGNTIYVGSGQKLEAWATADRAITGRSLKEFQALKDSALHWFLRNLIEDERPLADLAPFIVGCYANPTLAEAEVARRITAYGRKNLMNGSRTPYVSGAVPLPVTTCGPGSHCPHQYNRVSLLESIPRQVGVFAVYVPARFTGEVRGGRWNHYPIIHDRAFIAEQRRAAAQEQPEKDLREPDAYLLEFASRGMAGALDKHKGFDGGRARKFAGVIRELLQRNFFVVEVDHNGEPIEYHDARIAVAQFSMGEKVMRDIRKDVMQAATKDLPAIWEKVRDGTYIRDNGGNQAAYDPDAPALPPPNHVPFDPKKRKPFKQYPPSPVATKPSEDDPNLMGALARLAHLVQGGTPPPTNGVAMTYEEMEIERMKLG